ncbi:hypothetical protein ACTQ54_09875 [Fundicoccus sp. Sow4_H7]|uniref:hypothetical protein n=1 Tax=Fundicoccus sp. Sow4_H7 TaxID=3438784 RepID=UPI003F921893
MYSIEKRSIVLTSLTMILLLIFNFPVTVNARVAYETYSYNYWLDAVPSPHAYVPSSVISGDNIGVGEFSSPQDLFVSENGNIYIADTGNNRIVWFDQNFEFVDQIETFDNGDTFSSPQGIFVSEENHLYVADTENQRILHFNEENELINTFDTPVTDLLSNTTAFRPTKIAVNKAGQIYALAIGVNSGIVEINPDGTFQGFLGATEVSITPTEYFWRRFIATEEQRQRMGLILPTEYSNIFLDNEDFIYVSRESVSSSNYGDDIIRRLNPSGVNVLRDFGYGPPIGDYMTGGRSNISLFADVTVTDYHIYSAIDSNTGKIFTYDYDGQLLYVFGSNGNRFGNFQSPVAIGHFKDSLFVLDDYHNSLTIFDMTDYGKLIHDANRLHYEGDYAQVEQKWQEVLKLNANADIAYTGLGKAQYRNGEYQDAMLNFQLANDRDNYTKAFSRFRRYWLIDNFSLIAGVIAVIIGLFLVFKLIKKIRSFRTKEEVRHI